jgi:hypothetical protein
MLPVLVDTSFSVPFLFVVSVPVAVLATLAMDLVMPRLREGETPPRVASGVLTGRSAANAPRRLATAVHYVAGALTGPLYVWLSLIAALLVGPGPLAGVLSAVVLYPLMVAFFVVLVLPRSTDMPRPRARVVGRAWAAEALVYVLVLAPVVTAVAGRL